MPHAGDARDPGLSGQILHRHLLPERFAVIGAASTVFPGVEIGQGAVVGAMSLVRHDVPPNTVAVGVPAAIVGSSENVVCHEGRLDRVYPWWLHFRRGYPDGVLPELGDEPALGA